MATAFFSAVYAHLAIFLDIYRDFQLHREPLKDKPDLPLGAVLG